MRGFLLGGFVILAAAIAAAFHAVSGFMEIEDRIDAFPKTGLSEGSVLLQARRYDVYVDVPAGSGDFRWSLRVLDDARRELEIGPATSSVEYDLGGRSGMLVGKLVVPRAGRHLVRGTGPPGARVVFAQGVFGTVGSTILGATLIFLGGLAVGIAIIVVAVARRRGPQEPKRWP